MANFPPSDLLQWITRVHDAPRIFQICRTTFDRRFLPRAHHPISLRLMHHVYHCILSTKFIWSLRQWLFCSWYLSWSNLEESIDKIPIRIFTKKIYFTPRVKTLWVSSSFENRSPDRKWQSRYVFAPIGEGRGEGRTRLDRDCFANGSTFRRKKGGHSWEASTAQFGNLFLAGSPDRRRCLTRVAFGFIPGVNSVAPCRQLFRN